MFLKKVAWVSLILLTGPKLLALRPELQAKLDQQLMEAAKAGNSGNIAGALVRGANPNISDSQSGVTALMEAVTSQNKDAVSTLLHNGKADPNKESFRGLAPLDIAVMSNKRGITLELFDHGAKIGNQERYKRLIESAENNKNTTIKYDIEKAWQEEALDQEIKELKAQLIDAERRLKALPN